MMRRHRATSGGFAARLCFGLGLALLACSDGDAPEPRPSPEGGSGGSEEDASGAGGAGTRAEAGAGEGASGEGGTSGQGGAGGSGGSSSQELPEPDVDAIFAAGCATSANQARLLPSSLLFVIDRSSSMACNTPPTTSSEDCEADGARATILLPSKWEITREALVRAIENLPEETEVGLSYFSNDDACGVHSVPSVGLAALDRGQESAIRASLSTVQPGGATPIVGAVILAYRHLHRRAIDRELAGNRFVVLLTDGEQSQACSDPDRCDSPEDCTALLTESEVPKAAGPGVWIKTFVIGAPGSEGAKTVLSQIALAGGTAKPDCDPEAGDCHYELTALDSFADGLSSALNAIAVQTVQSCEIPMPSADDELDLARVNVVYSPGDGSEPEVVPQDAHAGCDGGADGWQYADEQTKIRLCGPACDAVRADPDGRLDVVLGCPVQGPD
jgi:hypothetical protein